VQPDGIDGQGEEQPADEERLHHDKGAVPEGEELEERPDAAEGDAEEPERSLGEADDERRAEVMLDRLGGGGVLLQDDSEGEAEGRGKAEGNDGHGKQD
jgi:hypothetical protein